MKTRITALLTGIVPAWTPVPALAHSYEDGRGFWPHDWEGGWSHMLFGSLSMILFWGGLILLIVIGIRWFGSRSGDGDGSEPRDTALDTLEKRFASGEMEKEDFEARKRLLME